MTSQTNQDYSRKIIRHYIETLFSACDLPWDCDNITEVEGAVDHIFDEIHQQVGSRERSLDLTPTKQEEQGDFTAFVKNRVDRARTLFDDKPLRADLDPDAPDDAPFLAIIQEIWNHARTFLDEEPVGDDLDPADPDFHIDVIAQVLDKKGYAVITNEHYAGMQSMVRPGGIATTMDHIKWAARILLDLPQDARATWIEYFLQRLDIEGNDDLLLSIVNDIQARLTRGYW